MIDFITREDCCDATVRAMTAYIRQLEGEINYQQRENTRLEEKIAELTDTVRKLNDEMLIRLCRTEQLNSDGFPSCINLNSDKDPFVDLRKEGR